LLRTHTSAALIPEALRESGFPRCTADVVTAELAKPERERSTIGRFAASQLKEPGGGHEPVSAG
jgi:hypothetical protein